MKTVALLVLAAACAAQPRVNPDAQLTADFQKHVDEYVKLRKSLEAKLPALKTGATPSQVTHHRRKLREMLQQERRGAKQGEFFTPPIEAEFRRLMGFADRGADANRVEKSLAHAEPVRLKLAVNGAYPDGVPIQSTPPTLLQNFPPLPPEIEYRVVGQQLVLVDAGANLILDISRGPLMPKAPLPEPSAKHP